jgi:hypothetical protein
MNRVMRSKSIGLVAILIPSLFVVGCNPCQQCILAWMTQQNMDFLEALFVCTFFGGGCLPETWVQTPDECSATLEQPQDAAMQFCGTYPEECREAFDVWVESLDTEAEK